MNIKILFFGITTDLVQMTETSFELKENTTIKDCKEALKEKYPTLKNMHSYAIAVNEIYTTDDVILKQHDVLAIIPPVSGG